jgi:hypothetical protein
VNEEGIRDLERRRLAALVATDLATAEALHADDYELIPPGGHPISKREYLDAIGSGALDYEVFEPSSEIRVRMFGSEAAAVRYKARIMIHDHEGGTDAGLFWHTDLYELRGGRWQAVWSQATRIRRPPIEQAS